MTVEWPPWQLPHPSFLPSPHRVAPAHSCHQNPSLSPPHCGANEFSCEAPQAQHVGRSHPQPGGPGPALEGPQPAFKSAQGVGGPDLRGAGVHGSARAQLRAPPRAADRAHPPALGLSSPARPSWAPPDPPSLALTLPRLSVDAFFPAPLTPRAGSWCQDMGGGRSGGPQPGGLRDLAQRLLGAVLSPVLASSSHKTWSHCRVPGRRGAARLPGRADPEASGVGSGSVRWRSRKRRTPALPSGERLGPPCSLRPQPGRPPMSCSGTSWPGGLGTGLSEPLFPTCMAVAFAILSAASSPVPPASLAACHPLAPLLVPTPQREERGTVAGSRDGKDGAGCWLRVWLQFRR